MPDYNDCEIPIEVCIKESIKKHNQHPEMHECRLVEIEVSHCYACRYHRPEGEETFYCADLQKDILHTSVDPIKLFPRECRFPIQSWWEDRKEE